MKDLPINLDVTVNAGSYYNSAKNEAQIDIAAGTLEKVTSFVHEMGHAEYHNKGQTVSITEKSLDRYVEGKASEEAECIVRTIEAKYELMREGYKPQEQRPDSFEREYLQASQRGRDREAGKQALVELILDGHAIRPDTFESSVDAWANEWKKYHGYDNQ